VSKDYNSIEVHCQKPSTTNFANLRPCHDHALSIVALFVTFFAICYSLHVRTTDGTSLCILGIKVLFLFFLLSIQVPLYLVGVSFKIVRMTSVKQFLVVVNVICSSIAGGRVGRGCCQIVRHSPSSSKMKNILNGVKEKIKYMFSTNFQLFSVRKNNWGGGIKN
jgi:hypothetical protein